MPNNNIISQEQKRKAINFRVAVAQENLENVQRYCDVYTLNSVDAKGNTALHLACEKSKKEILTFLFEQYQIDIHKKNNEGNKPLELVKNLSVDFIKNFDLKSILRNTIFLETINAIIKQKIVFGAPNWEQINFPEQKPTCASEWKANDPNFYRIDVLQEIMFLTEKILNQFEKNLKAVNIIFRIIHASLAEAFQVGRCDEQVAVAFNQFLLCEEEINLEWFQASSPDQRGGQNFLVLNRNLQFLACKDKPNEKPEAWREGWVLDPMDRRVDKINEITAVKLMGHLARIIGEPDIEKIKLEQSIAMKLPLKANHHKTLMTKLERIKKVLNCLLRQNWDEIWKKEINTALIKEHKICSDLSGQIEGLAKVCINQFFNILEAKIQAHQLKAQVAVNDTIESVEEIRSLKLN
ncbi:MAG: ankyrin repeat domain-containing protein [Gammaproteobacteria bacterium]|nr:MAG: ankyrin repeat domain-containing protein [Gammaproteobacteria bacterium]